MVRRFVRAHPFTCYYVLAATICASAVLWQYLYGQSWSASHGGAPFKYNETMWDGLTEFGHGRMYANVISLAWVAAMRNSVYFNVFLLGGAPTISALVITFICSGWRGIGRLFLRFKAWPTRAFRNDALWAYALVAAVYFGGVLINLAIMDQVKGPDFAVSRASIWGLPAAMLPLVYLVGGFLDEGAVQEELGWRGFALPVMLQKLSPLTTALWLGFLWWLWHFPREVPDMIAGKVVWASFIPGQFTFLMLVVFLSVIMTFFYHRTGGSVLIAMGIHGWSNFMNKGVSLFHVTEYKAITDVRLWICGIFAVLLVVIYRKDLGRRRFLELAVGASDDPIALPGSAPAL